MKLIIIRHGDPDYSIDSLTATGWKEAELLSHRLSKMDVTAFYCSPLGRAKDTAKPTLEKMGREATVLDWLREFPVVVNNPEGTCVRYYIIKSVFCQPLLLKNFAINLLGLPIFRSLDLLYSKRVRNIHV